MFGKLKELLAVREKNTASKIQANQQLHRTAPVNSSLGTAPCFPQAGQRNSQGSDLNSCKFLKKWFFIYYG
jgi:hypothetical protein